IREMRVDSATALNYMDRAKGASRLPLPTARLGSAGTKSQREPNGTFARSVSVFRASTAGHWPARVCARPPQLVHSARVGARSKGGFVSSSRAGLFVGAFTLLLCGAGCVGSIRETTTARTSTEQLLVSTAAERAIARFNNVEKEL